MVTGAFCILERRLRIRLHVWYQVILGQIVMGFAGYELVDELLRH